MNNLPQECISKILSLTSPRDVCRSSAVSTLFRSAADSHDVWNHFLPSDFPDGYASPEGLPTRKHLFFSLVDNPTLFFSAMANWFSQVAELIMVWWFHISGKINLTLLSDETLYASYLLFKWNNAPYGFRQPVEASLCLSGTDPDHVQSSMVSLMQTTGGEEGVPCAELRNDGWYEIELGQCFKRRGDMGEIEMALKETKRPFEKQGLIVHGIEIRPLS